MSLTFTAEEMMASVDKAKAHGQIEAYRYAASCIDSGTDPLVVADLLRDAANVIATKV